MKYLILLISLILCSINQDLDSEQVLFNQDEHVNDSSFYTSLPSNQISDYFNELANYNENFVTLHSNNRVNNKYLYRLKLFL